MREESIFAEALEKLTPAERHAFLDAACAGDDALRRRLDVLLAAHDQTVGILDRPDESPGWTAINAESAASELLHDEYVGAVIGGRFRLVERVGAGGMGTVWKAEQIEPVRRTVALKLIRAGLDSQTVLARFETERQALALMEHPNIARVLEGGTTEHGRPYFVMEYVEGVPITRYCDDARLTIAERLELVVPVCMAVQHAHTKGVIHRDLKPSNILVCVVDGRPTPKVIDFGLAKATRGPLANMVETTAHGVLLGTPLYMSPEQARSNNIDVDARTDIYALGVVLYELLTGSTPLEPRHFQEAAWQEVLRLIQEEDPPRPSIRLRASDSLPSLAACRHVEPDRLSRLVRGDLDWITMRCLAKERARRYATADGLARDIRNYLGDEPVEASPPTAGYRFGKFLRKHRRPILAAALVFLALVAGIVGTAWGLARANLALASESQRAERERLANERASKRLGQVEKAVELLTRVFHDIDPHSEQKEGRPLRAILADRLTRAASELEGDGVGDPLVVATLQNRLGQALIHLGFPGDAEPLLEKARATRGSLLGPNDPDTLAVVNNVARARQEEGKLADARALLEQILEPMRSSLGASHPDTLMVMSNLAVVIHDLGDHARATSLHEATLELRKARLGRDHRDTLVSMNNLACAYSEDMKSDLAIPLHQEALAIRKARLGPDHKETLDSMNNLAEAFRAAGRIDDALPLWEEALRRRKANFAREHPDTLVVMNNLATGYQSSGRLGEATAILEETLALSREKLGPTHPSTLRAMNNLADVYEDASQIDRAVALWEETFAIIKSRLGETHPNTLDVMQNLASGYQRAGNLVKARSLLEENVRLRRRHQSADQPEALMSMSNLASVYKGSGEIDKAIPLWEEVARGMRNRLGPDHPHALTASNNLGAGYRAAGKTNQALALFQEIASAVERDGFRHEFTGRFLDNLVVTLMEVGRPDEAEAWRRKSLEAARTRFGPDSPNHARELTALGELLVRRERWEPAEAVLRDATALWDRVEPEGWMRHVSRSLLGASMAGRGRLDEAEPMLRRAHEGIKAMEQRLPPPERERVKECLERLDQVVKDKEGPS